MYDYPTDTLLKASELWYASLSHTWEVNTHTLTLVLAVDNLTDLAYETIRGYPEPGRSFRLSMTAHL
jgi:outer membrane cobalamin receptor